MNEMNAMSPPSENVIIEVQGEHTFAAPPADVWRALHDAPLLAAAMPDCEQLTAIRPDQYLGRLRLHAGPVQTTLQGTVSLTPHADAHSYQITAQGSSEAGQAQGNGRIHLTPDADGSTFHYRGNISVSGDLAALGPDYLGTTARAIIRQNLTALARSLEQDIAEETAVFSPSPSRRSPLLLGGAFLAAAGGLLGLLALWRLLYRRWLDHLARRVAAILAEANGRSPR
jgi:carbon monoxide dehydrogenase subunit G